MISSDPNPDVILHAAPCTHRTLESISFSNRLRTSLFLSAQMSPLNTKAQHNYLLDAVRPVGYRQRNRLQWSTPEAGKQTDLSRELGWGMWRLTMRPAHYAP
ncbi:hypothetical protein Pth03_38880 [Planotetraspora thailandica]|uniref:Uncharacterized protein n=1 Tax=Planotetraspora thailandica TaxID=487172 RepID=A0A8J3V7N4_9ACTN|nr:hypothetical protein Pth03_38880 [Planotetraspora thailandica]